MKYHVLGGVALVVLLSATTFAFAAELTDVTLKAINEGNISNNGTVNAGKINGDGASVSVSATGAVAQISVTSVNTIGKNCVCTSEIHDVTMKAYNSGTVVNGGNVTTGNIKGAGASVSVSALGAGAVISVSSVNGRRH